MNSAQAAPNRFALVGMLAGAAIIGTNALMTRMAEMPPTAAAFWRMAIAAVLLFAWVMATTGWQKLPAKALAWCGVPALAFACDLWMWHRAIHLVGPGLSTLLANAQVFFMALAGALFFREKLTLRFVSGVALSFFGLWLLLGADWAMLPPQYRWGVWLGLATGIAYAFYNVGTRQANAHASDANGVAPVAQVLCIAAFGSAVVLGIFGLLEGADMRIPSVRSAAFLFVLAAFGHCLAWILISRAMSALSVAMVGLLLLLQPIVAYLFDVFLLDLQTSPRQWLGLLATLAGIFLAGVRPKRRAAMPED